MRSIRFFLLSSTLAAICFSTVAARAGTVIASLSGSFQNPGVSPAESFVFHADDNSSMSGNWWSPDPGNYLGNPDYYYNKYCSSGPCNISWSGDITGMPVFFQTLMDFNGFVTSGHYLDYMIVDELGDFYNEELVSYDFTGNWSPGYPPSWSGMGSMSSVLGTRCIPLCRSGWNWSANIVTTTPEPGSFILICTGALGIARARRCKTANCKLIQWL
jgi:hypothetical protein